MRDGGKQRAVRSGEISRACRAAVVKKGTRLIYLGEPAVRQFLCGVENGLYTVAWAGAGDGVGFTVARGLSMHQAVRMANKLNAALTHPHTETCDRCTREFPTQEIWRAGGQWLCRECKRISAEAGVGGGPL